MLKVDLSAQYQEFSNHNWGERERAQTLCWFNSPDKAFPLLFLASQLKAKIAKEVSILCS